MGIIGGELGLFFAGLLYLLKGRTKLSATKEVSGIRVRLAGLAFVLPIPITVLIAQITGSPQQGLLANSVTLLAGATGIALSIVGVVIGIVLIYTAPSRALSPS
jgi:hypothetical protein